MKDAFEGLRAFVINLDRSTERLVSMQQRLAPTGLVWQRVPAIDGCGLDPTRHESVDEKTYRRWHGKSLNPAEVGCYLSHIEVMRLFLAGPWRYALVLEDDAAFPPDFIPLMKRLLAHDDRWDIVKLSCVHSGTPVPIARLLGNYKLAVPLSRHNNSNCIVLNRRAAQVLLDRLLPMKLPYDHAIERAWLWGLRLRVVTPAPCAADTGLASTITPGLALYRKFPQYKRVPAFLFRLLNEAARAVYQLTHVVREALL